MSAASSGIGHSPPLFANATAPDSERFRARANPQKLANGGESSALVFSSGVGRRSLGLSSLRKSIHLRRRNALGGLSGTGSHD